MTLRPVRLLLAGVLLGTPAFANPTDAVDVAEGPDPDAIANDSDSDDAVEEGVWTWVARMEDEVPDPEMVRAIREKFEELQAEAALMEDLGPPAMPTEFYEDPAAALSVDPLQLDLVDPAEFDIPIVINDEVEKWMEYFIGGGRKYYARWLSRSTRYRPMMYAALDARDLPADLVYLSMIESGYNAHAYSHAHAVGLWQFIPSTGRLYDLRVDWWVDERRDPQKSTDAALSFLADLHDMFGSWELAWAAYNGGPGRVRRALTRAGTDDFWAIADGDYLHSETENYVPKIMAAAIIGKHPERYGFTEIAYGDELLYDTATVDGMVEVAVLAECAGMTEEAFRWYNPALRRWATPEGRTEVRVAVGTHEAFVAALDEVPHSERLTFVRHTVARGDTLSVIAARYAVTVSDLVRVNELRNADRIFVGMSLIVPTGGVEALAEVGVRATDAPARPARATSHTVKRGDTLSGIAARYGVRVADLQRWNAISGSKIYAGQVLTLDGRAAPSESVSYTVRRGDSLSAIASRFGVALADVQKWNRVRDPSTIYVGQTLTLHVADSGWSNYTVVAGDSLGSIGRRHGCSVSELQSWNGLSGTVIHPGQQLKIRR